MRKIVLILVLGLAGCATHLPPQLISQMRDGSDTTYVYFEDGRYYTYRFHDGQLVSRERLDR